jgi:hypothetical protein
MAQIIEHLLCKREALSSNLSHTKGRKGGRRKEGREGGGRKEERNCENIKG